MDEERRARLPMVCCQIAALLLVVVLTAGQYRALLPATPPPQLPVTGSQQQKVSFWERLMLGRQLRTRYDQLRQVEGLTEEQLRALGKVETLLAV